MREGFELDRKCLSMVCVGGWPMRSPSLGVVGRELEGPDDVESGH
jgi:hypothetical protein